MSRPGPLRVAIIGAGFGQKVHVPAFRRSGRAEVTALCSRSAAKAEAAAQALGIPVATSSWRALCEDPAIDVVAVSVPAAAQPAILEAAAAGGKHVFCEKPLGVDLDAARAATEAVTRSGVVNAVDFELRVVPAFVRARELCRAGVMGRLRQIRASWHIETPLYREPVDHWKLRARDGGGALHLFGSHVLDYLTWFFGPLAPQAARAGAPPHLAGDARFDAWLCTERGVPVDLSLAADAFCGTGHRLEVFGDEGTLVLANPTADYIDGFRLSLATRAKPALVEVMEPVSSGEDGRIGAVAALVARFLAHCVGAGPGEAGDDLPTLEDGLRSLRLAETLRKMAT